MIDMKLTDKIHLLRIDFEITLGPGRKLPRFVNTIIILGDRVTLIDTGVKGSEDLIFKYLGQYGRKPVEIDRIILSHSHPDHMGSAARIKELTGCKVLAHEIEKEWIEQIDIQNEQRPVPGFYDLLDRSVTLDEFLSDQQTLTVQDDLTLKFIHAPGHSKGSLNILFKEDRILFTADSIPLKNDIPNYDNYQELIESLETIKANKDYNMLLNSWTPPLADKGVIDKTIRDGEDYLKGIDVAVRACYKSKAPGNLDPCRLTVEKLGMPPFLVNPIVDRAFRSHLA